LAAAAAELVVGKLVVMVVMVQSAETLVSLA
jgi:hypothetical protein